MRRATPDEFLAAPAGRYVASRTFVHFCADERCWGTLMSGCPDEDEIRKLARVQDAELAAGAAPHVSLLDASRMTAVDGAAYAAFNDYLGRRKGDFDRLVERQSIVRPSGMAGATVSGYLRVSPVAFPARVFDSTAEALAWIDRPDLLGAVQALGDELRGSDPVVRELRAHLEASGDGALAEACRVLGLSERSLQRRLAAAGTTFRAEVLRARVEHAKRLLVETELKLSAIALQVGCASSQHFSDLFREQVGQSPSAWRAATRATTVHEAPARLAAARHADAFLAAPLGRFVAGDGWVVWCATPRLCGSRHAGALGGDAMRELVRFLAIGDAPGLRPPLDVITDGSAVTGWDERAYARLLDALAEMRPRLGALIRRQAVVLAPGTHGAIMAGIPRLLDLPYELRTFDRAAEAFAWCASPSIAALVDAIDRRA